MNARRIDFQSYCVISVWFGCNNDCAICMLSKLKSGLPAIGFESYRSVLGEIVRGGRFRNLILSGAEVTTFDDLERYVRCAASLEWFRKIQIQTNGRRLSERGYLDRLIGWGVNEFFVSIHGFEETHEAATRVPGSFGETIAGLKNLSRSGMNVITNTVLTKRNLREMVRFIAFLCEEAMSEIHLWNYFPMGKTDEKDLVVSLAELIDLLPELSAVVEAAGKVMVLKSFPLCLSAEPPVYFDSVFPVTVLPERFWQEFRKCGFGRCVHREAGECSSVECWGLSSAYLGKYGEEGGLLKPIPSLCREAETPSDPERGS